jgi:hypothetical protein
VQAGEHELEQSPQPITERDQPDPHPRPRVKRTIDEQHEQQEEKF